MCWILGGVVLWGVGIVVMFFVIGYICNYNGGFMWFLLLVGDVGVGCICDISVVNVGECYDCLI